jgi:hypothetical protein
MIKRKNEKLAKYNKLLGLRNTTHQDAMPKEAMEEAVNFDHGDGFTMERRDGYAKSVSLSSCTDGFSPVVGEGLYVVAGGTLKSYSDALVATDVATGLTDTTFSWAEMDRRVFYAGATDAGIVLDREDFVPLRVPVPASVTVTTVAGNLTAGDYIVAVVYQHDDSGIEGGATLTTHTLLAAGGLEMTVPAVSGHTALFYVSEANGEVPYYVDDSATTLEYSTHDNLGLPLDPEQRESIALPTGIVALTAYDARLYAATYDSTTDTSTVMWSGVFYPHLWALHKDYFPVRGQVLAMHGTASGLLVGTTDRIFLHDGESLRMLAAFGVIPGKPFHSDKEGRTAIWTTRGVCTFPDFKSLQMEKVAVAPGTSCTTALVDRRGRKQFIAVTDGNGTAWNAWS